MIEIVIAVLVVVLLGAMLFACGQPACDDNWPDRGRENTRRGSKRPAGPGPHSKKKDG